MITSYCIYKKGETNDLTADTVMYDYGGCTYPEGILDTSLAYGFNHSQIEKIVYMGYKTEEQTAFSTILNGGYKKYMEKLAEDIKQSTESLMK